MHTIDLHEESGGEGTYLYVRSPDEVIELVQFNAIEFHPWASTIKNTDVTDYLVFDLDPGPDVAWKAVVAGAELLRKRLGDLDLDSFVRTVRRQRLARGGAAEARARGSKAKDFARTLSDSIVEAQPDAYIATASKAKRGGVIFIDYLRNSRGATSVASYSLRSRAGAPVAVPLRWDELRKLKSAADFTLGNVPARLKRQRRDPWQGFAALRQSLPKKFQLKYFEGSTTMSVAEMEAIQQTGGIRTMPTKSMQPGSRGAANSIWADSCATSRTKSPIR